MTWAAVDGRVLLLLVAIAAVWLWRRLGDPRPMGLDVWGQPDQDVADEGVER